MTELAWSKTRPNIFRSFTVTVPEHSAEAFAVQRSLWQERLQRP